jgi:hypothetical protein
MPKRPIRTEAKARLGYFAGWVQARGSRAEWTGMRGCAVEGAGIGWIDAAGSDPNEDLVSAWRWTQHIRHAEVHT